MKNCLLSLCVVSFFFTNITAQKIEYGASLQSMFNYFQFENSDYFEPLKPFVSTKPRLSIFANFKTSDAFYVQVNTGFGLKATKLKYADNSRGSRSSYNVEFDFLSYDIGLNGRYLIKRDIGLFLPYLGMGFSWNNYASISESISSFSIGNGTTTTTSFPELILINTDTNRFFYPAIEGGLSIRPNVLLSEEIAHELSFGLHYSPKRIDDISTGFVFSGLNDGIRGRFLIISIGWNILFLK